MSFSVRPVFLLLVAGASALASEVDDGKRLYRDGLLPSGEPVTALVSGDVEIQGAQFSCVSCHGHSGMGAVEGDVIVPPIAAPFLYVPSPQPQRPAYTRESLAHLLATGTTPAGRNLGTLMPRYRLPGTAVDALDAYLRTLSDRNSPGVDDETLRFATVIGPDVDPVQAEAMLAVFDRYFADINRQTRNEQERWDRGYTPESRLPTVFREWTLDVWQLEGPPSSWQEQLQEHYDESPVFALVGGLTATSWQPVDAFCESRQLPCLFPLTSAPILTGGGFYSRYFSRGLALETAVISRDLRGRGVTKLVQVVCGAPARAAAEALADSLPELSNDYVPVDCAGPASLDLSGEAVAAQDTALVVWANRQQVEALAPLPPFAAVYVSSTLAGENLKTGSWPSHDNLSLVHPYILPDKADPATRRFRAWARSRGVDVSVLRVQSGAFFACLVLKDLTKHIGRFFIREFALDTLDHAQGLMAYMPGYPRPTIGPGQPFANKGAYLISIVDGQLRDASAEWVIP